MIFNSIIPLPFYTPLFYIVMLFIILLSFLKLQIKGYTIYSNRKEYISFILLVAVTLYMGLRPISFMFGDMGIYNNYFENFANGGEITNKKDYLWQLFLKFSSSIMSAKTFFFICAILYVVPLYSACKKWFGNNMYIPFLMFVASFSFWAYGTNGIRNGIATSFTVYALAYNKNKYFKYFILALAYSFHASIIIPISAYVLTLFYSNSKHYLIGWFIAIFLSLALGGFWENLFVSFGFGGGRLTHLTGERYEDIITTGFRWDFLIYSTSAIFTGYYFIYKKKFKDPIYIQLFNIYVTANAFWILIIRSGFSNRIAYLSWFLMAAVIFYPFFKQQFFKQQQRVLAFTVLIYYGFTYFMFLIL